MNYEAVLTDMVTVAREAGALTLRHFARFRDLEIGVKGPADFVSDADRESEQLIRKFLFARYPDWSFTGEEFPPVEMCDGTVAPAGLEADRLAADFAPFLMLKVFFHRCGPIDRPPRRLIHLSILNVSARHPEVNTSPNAPIAEYPFRARCRTHAGTN